MELLAERGYNVLNNPMPTMALIAAGACFSPYVLGGILITDLLLHHRDLWQSSTAFAQLLCTDTPEAVAHFWAFCIEMALLHKAATTLQAAGQQAINAAMPRIKTTLNELATLARQEEKLALASRGALDLAAMPHSELLKGVKNAAKVMNEEAEGRAALRQATDSAADSGLLNTEHQLNTAAINVTEPVDTFSGWYMPKGGAVINGRKYTEHALERMAPKTGAVRDELSKRAFRERISGGCFVDRYFNVKGVKAGVFVVWSGRFLSLFHGSWPKPCSIR